MACGHRLMLGSHTTSSTVAAIVTRRAALAAASPRQVTNYGWRTRPAIFSEESNAPGVRCWRQRRRGGSGGVVADIAKRSVGREEYYTRELATDHASYLSGHGESPGRWYGAGATALGLEGEASPAGFQRMFEGRDPTTGELLGRPHGRNAVPAFDVVL